MAASTARDFSRPGWVSIWASSMPLPSVPYDVLEGGEELLTWLSVDYDIDVGGAYATSYAARGELEDPVALLANLHAAAVFADAAAHDARRLGAARASLILALYDVAYELVAEAGCDSAQLRFVGAYRYVVEPEPRPR